MAARGGQTSMFVAHNKIKRFDYADISITAILISHAAQSDAELLLQTSQNRAAEIQIPLFEFEPLPLHDGFSLLLRPGRSPERPVRGSNIDFREDGWKGVAPGYMQVCEYPGHALSLPAP